MEKNFIVRIIVEYNELLEKLNKIKAFIGSSKFKELTGLHRRLLEEQYDIMEKYVFVLRTRIELLDPDFEEEE